MLSTLYSTPFTYLHFFQSVFFTVRKGSLALLVLIAPSFLVDLFLIYILLRFINTAYFLPLEQISHLSFCEKFTSPELFYLPVFCLLRLFSTIYFFFCLCLISSHSYLQFFRRMCNALIKHSVVLVFPLMISRLFHFFSLYFSLYLIALVVHYLRHVMNY